MLPHDSRNSTIGIHKTLKILDVNQLLITEVCKFAFDFHKNTISKSFTSTFQYNSSIHSHRTRSNNGTNSFHIPQKLAFNQVAYLGSINWNKYCLDLNTLNNKNLFCKKLKSKLINETH